jgi:hypothetical protein
MRRKISWGLALGALGLAAVAAGPIEAQEAAPPPACAAPVAPTGELAPWTTPFQLKAAETETTTSQSRLPIGQAAVLLCCGRQMCVTRGVQRSRAARSAMAVLC